MSDPEKKYTYFIWCKCDYCMKNDKKGVTTSPCIKMIPYYINTYLTENQIMNDLKSGFEKDIRDRLESKCLGKVSTDNVKWELITFEDVLKFSQKDDTQKHTQSHKDKDSVIDRFADLDIGSADENEMYGESHTD